MPFHPFTNHFIFKSRGFVDNIRWYVWIPAVYYLIWTKSMYICQAVACIHSLAHNSFLWNSIFFDFLNDFCQYCIMALNNTIQPWRISCGCLERYSIFQPLEKFCCSTWDHYLYKKRNNNNLRQNINNNTVLYKFIYNNSGFFATNYNGHTKQVDHMQKLERSSGSSKAFDWNYLPKWKSTISYIFGCMYLW